ncbi:MAG: GNAT family N-acetyltransferase [Erysipelotrichaceae bacterium]|nr:GNAT family N-acetyltransferase [Erysipelotrichaceae bacterium]
METIEWGDIVLVLRDMKESDIEDYVRWFTVETEWGDWDAPWEPFNTDEETERRNWTEYYHSVKELPQDRVRRKYEIESDGKHIGWICSYTDLEYVDNEEKIPAIGLDIPCVEDRKCGLGTKAFQSYLDYLKEHGYRSFYTQTWSGNQAMIRLAGKLGFNEIARKKDHREVDGRKYDAITYRLDL